MLQSYCKLSEIQKKIEKSFSFSEVKRHFSLASLPRKYDFPVITHFAIKSTDCQLFIYCAINVWFIDETAHLKVILLINFLGRKKQ